MLRCDIRTIILQDLYKISTIMNIRLNITLSVPFIIVDTNQVYNRDGFLIETTSIYVCMISLFDKVKRTLTPEGSCTLKVTISTLSESVWSCQQVRCVCLL